MTIYVKNNSPDQQYRDSSRGIYIDPGKKVVVAPTYRKNLETGEWVVRDSALEVAKGIVATSQFYGFLEVVDTSTPLVTPNP